LLDKSSTTGLCSPLHLAPFGHHLVDLSHEDSNIKVALRHEPKSNKHTTFLQSSEAFTVMFSENDVTRAWGLCLIGANLGLFPILSPADGGFTEESARTTHQCSQKELQGTAQNVPRNPLR
jgi:hypothetical protein